MVDSNEDDTICSCTGGWTGTECNICPEDVECIKDSCSSMCENGGQCVIYNAEEKCNCENNWSGVYCDIDEKPANMYSRKILSSAVMVTFLVVSIFLIVTALVIHAYRKYSDRRNLNILTGIKDLTLHTGPDSPERSVKTESSEFSCDAEII